MSMCVTVDTAEENDIAGAKSSLPTLAAMLACREASPGIMEHEKTILVMKEHDYAKTPDMSQLAPFFHYLTGDAATNTDTQRKQNFRRGSSVFNVRQALADARMSLLKDDGAVSNHLNKMVSLQATLIQQLQEQVFFKGLETTTIKIEKEQLQARLDRMERRLNILQKRSKRDDDPEPDRPPSPTTPNINTGTPLQGKPEQITRLARSETATRRNSRSRSSSTETASRRNSRTHTPNSLEVSHRAGKRCLEGGGGSFSASKKTRSSSPIDKDLTTNELYDGLGLSMPAETQFDCLEDNSPLNKNDTPSSVKVPSWRNCCPISAFNNKNGEVIEDTSDESFAKRHSKHESEEKRRKRWDAQRMRERLHHNQLLKRYMMKEGCSPQQEKKKDRLASFFPKLEDIKEIEVTDSLVVSAFGKPLPVIKPSIFKLPNFDPTTIKNTRGKLKGKVSQNSTSGVSV